MQRRNLLKTASLSALMGGFSSWAENIPSARGKAPEAGGPELPQKIQRIAFGSCIDQTKPQPIQFVLI